MSGSARRSAARPARSGRAGRFWRSAAGVAAATAVGAVVWSWSESSPGRIGVKAVGPWLFTPAFPLALLAARRRHPVLAGIAALVGVGQLVALWPDVGHFGADEADPGAVRLRLVTANMLLDNDDVAGFSQEILSYRADLVLLQEVTPSNLYQLKEAGLLDRYAHQVLDPLDGAHGSIILSRLPLREADQIDVAGWPMTAADVLTDAGRLRVVNVHAVAPLERDRVTLWERQLAELRALTAPDGGHLLLAGDFNATRSNRAFSALLSDRLRDAYVQAGRGPGNTWPSNGRVVPPLLRIDHVLVSPSVAVTGIRAGRGTGSDHRPLIADLALPPRRE